MAVTGEAPPVDPARSLLQDRRGAGEVGADRGLAPLWGFAGAAAVVGAGVRAATGGTGTAGGLAGLTDVAIALGFVLFAAAVLRPYAAAAGAGNAPPTYRSHVQTWAQRIVPVVWLVVLASYLFPPERGAAQATTGFGTAASGATSVPFAALLRGLTFTQPYGPDPLGGPVAHLWPLAAAVAFVLVAPLLARSLWPARVRATDVRRSSSDRRRPLLGAGILALTAVAYRVAASAAAPEQPWALRWLPAHLDAVAAGVVLVAVAAPPTAEAPRGDLLGQARRTFSAPGAAVVGWAVAALSWLAAVYGLGLSHAALVVGGFRGLLQHLLFVVAAAAVAVAMAVRDQAGPAGTAGRAASVAGRLAYPAFAWSAVAIGRWASAPAGTIPGAPAPPARHPGALGDVALVPTVAWTVVVSAVLAVLTWLLAQRPWRRHRRPLGWFAGGLWAISAVSFGLRIWSFGTLNARNPGNGDPFYYHAQANMLADGVGFGEPFTWLAQHRFVATAIHPPLFTLWLTPASMLGARGFLAHKAMAAIAGVGVVVVAGLLGRRLAGPRVGLIAAALVALYPDLWIVDGTLWPEGLYTALIGLALLGTYRWLDQPTLPRAALVGAAIGAAILTRGEAILALGFLVLPLAWAARHRARRAPVHVAVMGLVALGLLAPWTIRNLAVFDRPVPVSTNSEEVLYYANCPDTYRGPLIGYWSFSCQQRARQDRVAAGLPADPPGDEAERSAGWGALGRRYAGQHRDRWPAVVTARVLRVWDLAHADTTARALTFEGRAYEWARRGLWAYRAVLIPGLIGLAVLRRRRQVPVWPLLAMGAMVTFTAAAVYGHIRFRTVGDLVLLVGAAVAFGAVLPGRSRGPEPAPARAATVPEAT